MISQAHTTADMAKMHLLVLIWGFTAILGALITLPSVEMVLYRTFLAAVGLYFLIKWKKERIYLPFKSILRLLGIGVLIGAHWIFFFASAKISTISVCLAGMATTSLFTSLVEPLILKRKVFKHEVFLGLMVIIGLYIIFKFEVNHAMGLIFALISALLAALFSVLNSKETNRAGHRVITFYEMVGAFAAIGLFLPFYASFMTSSGAQLKPNMWDLLWLFLLSGICTVYAYSQWVELMKRITAFASNLIINLEPVYGIILALLIFGEKERMEHGFYFGTAVILGAVFLYPVLRRLHKNRKPTVKELL